MIFKEQECKMVEIVSVGEEKDGTPFITKHCHDCGLDWKEYREWSLGKRLDDVHFE